MAAQLAPAETEEDIVCANVVQNIFVVSSPTKKNACAYARVEALLVGTARYEVNSYLAAPDNTCKGIVRGGDLDFDHNQLRDMIVQPRNPKALEVKRSKDTTTIIALFDGLMCRILSCAAPACFAVRCTDARRTFATPAEGWVTGPTCARPRRTRFAGDAEPRLPRKTMSGRPMNASKCPTSSAAAGGSGNAPQKHLRRRWRPAYGPPAKVMIRACRGRPRGGAPPRWPAAAAGPLDAPAPVGALALAGALARESRLRRPPGLIESSRSLLR
ncbi:hypothetical protein MTO96_034476 [Rhipicephalus appendiculatus]